ncbi:MAG: hypothetical protein IJM02_04985 [Clostridia bacterium]|nr:hypothetical protein [Clostridia bacterium]
MSKDIKYYPFTPAQEMINFMLKYSFFHKQVIQIPASIVVKRKIDFDLMQKALEIEIERNDCMRLRFEKKGGCRQYFADSINFGKVPVKTFSSLEEQEAFLTADAQKPIRFLKGETYRMYFFNTADGRYGIYINVIHLAMDAPAVFIFFADLLAVYEALESGSEMPKPLGSFETAIQKELEYINNEDKVNADKDFYINYFKKDGEPVWNGVMGPGPLDRVREKKKNPDLKSCGSFDPIHDQAVLEKKTLSVEDSKIILDYMEKNSLSGECVVQLGMRLHVGKINHRHDDTHFLVLSNRRKTLNDKRCGGTLASALPWRVILPEDLTFAQAVEKLRLLQSEIMRHNNYPFINWLEEERKLFNYSMKDGTTTMMFSWFPLEDNTMNGWDYEFHGYSIGHYVMPLYTYAMKDSVTGGLRFAYLHRTDTISSEDIDRLQDNTVKALVMGCSNPDITLKEILDNID